MIQDESAGPQQPFLQANAPQPQQQQNALGGLTQQKPQISISKPQFMAALHHFEAVKKQITPLLKNPVLGKGNIRPKLFDAMANLIGQGTMTVPEVINGMKDLPDDPVDQKKWLETKVAQTDQAEQGIIAHYIAQGPISGLEQEYHPDNHKEHMTSLLGQFKRG